jgi:hypothetical protein
MKAAKHIQELEQLQANQLINDIAMPYNTPDKYFEELPNILTSYASLANNKGDNSINLSVTSHNAKINPQEVSKDYFDTFSSKILNIIQQEEQLEQCLPASKTPFSVDEKYFDDFVANISKAIPTEEKPLLNSIKKTPPYELDNNFFDNFEQQILDVVKEENNESLKGLSKKMPFAIDPNYFTDFTQNITNQIRQQEVSSSTISFDSAKKKRFSFKNFATTAAATVALFLGSKYAIDFNDINESTRSNSKNLIAGISQDAINEYIDMNLDDFEITQLSAVANNNSKFDPKIQEIINNISDEEIENYLETVEL